MLTDTVPPSSPRSASHPAQRQGRRLQAQRLAARELPTNFLYDLHGQAFVDQLLASVVAPPPTGGAAAAADVTALVGFRKAGGVGKSVLARGSW